VEGVASTDDTTGVPTTLKQLDWLWLFLASWVLPLAQEIVRPLTYLSSLAFWFLPTLLLLPRFLDYTDAGGRRRKALLLSTANIVVTGVVLDFVLGSFVLKFDEAHPSNYLYWFTYPALNIHIPVEEVLFYVISPVAILLVYAWADEYWVAAYTARTARQLIKAKDRLVQLSPHAPAVGLAMLASGIYLHRRLQPAAPVIPVYFTFLVLAGLGPATLVFKTVARLVNWRAFGVTLLYLLVTSLVWEAALAIPRHWWGYQAQAMIGVQTPWTIDPNWELPVEAVMVWLAAPFSCILLYESAKFVMYRRSPDKPTFVHPSLRNLAEQPQVVTPFAIKS